MKLTMQVVENRGEFGQWRMPVRVWDGYLGRDRTVYVLKDTENVSIQVEGYTITLCLNDRHAEVHVWGPTKGDEDSKEYKDSDDYLFNWGPLHRLTLDLDHKWSKPSDDTPPLSQKGAA